MASNDDAQLIELLDEVDAIEANIATLRPTLVGVVGRSGTYFGVLAALTVSLIEPPYVVPWMFGTLAVSLLPEARRLWKRRALARTRDELLTRRADQAVGTLARAER